MLLKYLNIFYGLSYALAMYKAGSQYIYEKYDYRIFLFPVVVVIVEKKEQKGSSQSFFSRQR